MPNPYQTFDSKYENAISLGIIMLFNCRTNQSKILHTILCPYHTHIIGHYNSSVRKTALLLTSHMLYALILHVSSGTYNLMSTSNVRFFRKYFMTGRLCRKYSTLSYVLAIHTYIIGHYNPSVRITF